MLRKSFAQSVSPAPLSGKEMIHIQLTYSPDSLDGRPDSHYFILSFISQKLGSQQLFGLFLQLIVSFFKISNFFGII